MKDSFILLAVLCLAVVCSGFSGANRSLLTEGLQTNNTGGDFNGTYGNGTYGNDTFTNAQGNGTLSPVGIATLETKQISVVVALDLSSMTSEELLERAEAISSRSNGSQVTTSFVAQQSIGLPLGVDDQAACSLQGSIGKSIAGLTGQPATGEGCDTPPSGLRRSLLQPDSAVLKFYLNSRTLEDQQKVHALLSDASSSGRLATEIQGALQQQLEAALLESTSGIDVEAVRQILAGGLTTPAPQSLVVFVVEVTQPVGMDVGRLQDTLSSVVETTLTTNFGDIVTLLPSSPVLVDSVALPAVLSLEVHPVTGQEYILAPQTACIPSTTFNVSYVTGFPVRQCLCGLLYNDTSFPNTTTAVEALAGSKGEPRQAFWALGAWQWNTTTWTNCTGQTEASLNVSTNGFYQFLVKCSTEYDGEEVWATGRYTNFKVDTIKPNVSITPVTPALGIFSWDPAAYDFRLFNFPRGVFTFNVSISEQCLNDTDSVAQPGVQTVHRWDNGPWEWLDAPTIANATCRKDYFVVSPQFMPGGVHTLQVKSVDCAGNEGDTAYYSFYYSNDTQTGSRANCKMSYVLDEPGVGAPEEVSLEPNTYGVTISDMRDGVYFMHLKGQDSFGNTFPPANLSQTINETWIVDTACPTTSFRKSWNDEPFGDATTVGYEIEIHDGSEDVDGQPVAWTIVSGDAEGAILDSNNIRSAGTAWIVKSYNALLPERGAVYNMTFRTYDDVGNNCPDQDLNETVQTEFADIFLVPVAVNEDDVNPAGTLQFCGRIPNITKALDSLRSITLSRVAFRALFRIQGTVQDGRFLSYQYQLSKYDTANCTWGSPVAEGDGEGLDSTIVFKDLGEGLYRINLNGTYRDVTDPSPYCGYFNIDQSAPVVTFTTPPKQTYSLTDMPALVRGTVVDTDETCASDVPRCHGCFVTFALSPWGDGEWGYAPAALDGTWSVNLPDGLPHGQYVLTAVGHDNVRQASKPVKWTFSVDLVAPDTAVSTSYNETSDQLVFNVWCAGEGPCRYLYAVDNTSATEGSGLLTVPRNLSVGAHWVSFSAIDQASNTDPTPFKYLWYIDAPSNSTETVEPLYPFQAVTQNILLRQCENCFGGDTTTVPDDSILFGEDDSW